jgi:hypothetical protein
VPMLAVGLRLAFDPRARALRLGDDNRNDKHKDATEVPLTSSG